MMQQKYKDLKGIQLKIIFSKLENLEEMYKFLKTYDLPSQNP